MYDDRELQRQRGVRSDNSWRRMRVHLRKQLDRAAMRRLSVRRRPGGSVRRVRCRLRGLDIPRLHARVHDVGRLQQPRV